MVAQLKGRSLRAQINEFSCHKITLMPACKAPRDRTQDSLPAQQVSLDSDGGKRDAGCEGTKLH
jgi:hypothetical protein